MKVRHEGEFVVGDFRNPDIFDGVLVGEILEGRVHFRGRGGGVGLPGGRRAHRAPTREGLPAPDIAVR